MILGGLEDCLIPTPHVPSFRGQKNNSVLQISNWGDQKSLGFVWSPQFPS